VAAHPLAQHDWPGAHDPASPHWSLQLPPMHASPAVHTVPQLPQLLGSLATLLQPLTQHDSAAVHAGPPAHDVVQLPLTHDPPFVQTLPHPPQL
jgi:hypothetical protein